MTLNLLPWWAYAAAGAVAGALLAGGLQQARVSNVRAELAQVREQHAKAVADAVTKALAQEREDRAKETTHAADTTKNVDQFTQGQPERDASLRADLARSERLRLDADRRAATYKTMSASCAAASSGVADRLAALDRQLVAGVGVVGRLRGDLERRDAEVVLLAGQLAADRKLTDSAPTAPALPASAPTGARARP